VHPPRLECVYERQAACNENGEIYSHFYSNFTQNALSFVSSITIKVSRKLRVKITNPKNKIANATTAKHVYNLVIYFIEFRHSITMIKTFKRLTIESRKYSSLIRSAAMIQRAPIMKVERAGMFSESTGRGFSSDTHDDFKPKLKSIPDDENGVLSLIDEQVKANDIMLYMKGTPAAPQCGFSMQVVRILNAVGAEYSSVNVLEFPAIRDGIKTYGEWPTIPQVYVKGEFVGGCDIMTQMFTDGDLENFMKEKGIVIEE
jgi:monothiol glutaredoxin